MNLMEEQSVEDLADLLYNDIGARSGVSGGVCDLSPEFRLPLQGFFSRPVVNGHLMSAAHLEVPSHGVPHDTQSDKCDSCH
jgi:hypothetical protein